MSSQPRENNNNRKNNNNNNNTSNSNSNNNNKNKQKPKAGGRPKPAKKEDSNSLKSSDKTNTKLVENTQASTSSKGDKGKAKLPELGEEVYDDSVCFICADPYVHYALGPCNHKCCYKCCLRTRALYKSNLCPVCKSTQDKVVFTDNPTKLFGDYNLDTLGHDPKLDIYFDSGKAKEDTESLLRFNCPVNGCGFVAAGGYLVLKGHVSSVHDKLFCELCVDTKRIFYCEHTVYSRNDLQQHIKHGTYTGKKGGYNKKDDGFRGHPYCAFCKARFYDSDALFNHCREHHEECFICKANNPKSSSLYKNYEALEAHFSKDHFICSDPQCLAKRFVVFSSSIDLRAHEVDEHPGKFSGLQRSKQIQARKICIDLDFAPSEGSSRPGGQSSSSHSFTASSSSSNVGGANRRVRAPAGFGMSSGPQPEPVQTSQPSAPVQEPQVATVEESWPSLNGDSSNTSHLSSLPASYKTSSARRAPAQNNEENWPGLPSASSSRAKPTNISPTIAKKKASNKEAYSKQFVDKRPPLSRPTHSGPVVLPPPLPNSNSLGLSDIFPRLSSSNNPTSVRTPPPLPTFNNSNSVQLPPPPPKVKKTSPAVKPSPLPRASNSNSPAITTSFSGSMRTSLPSISNSTTTVPTFDSQLSSSGKDLLSKLLKKDKSKIESFTNLIEFYRTGAINSSELIQQMDELFRQAGHNGSAGAHPLAQIIPNLSDVLNKTMVKQLQAAHQSFLKTSAAFPQLPTRQPTKQNPSVRKVLVIKSPGSGGSKTKKAAWS